MTDEAIVNQMRGGDREAFALLVDRYRSAVYGLAFHRLQNSEDAQDAAQEAFVQAFQRIGQLHDPAKFAPWLRRITVNACHARRKGLTMDALPDTLPETGDMAARVETRVVVEAALACLSPQTRLTLTLFYVQEHSLAEIAAFLDVPVTAIKSRLRDARSRLRKELIPLMKDTLMPEPLPADFTGKVMRNIETGGDVRFVRFSPDGRLFATAALRWLENDERESEVQVWEVATGGLRARTVVRSWVSGVCWALDNQTLFYGCGITTRCTNDGYPSRLRRWDWQTDATRDVIELKEGPVCSHALAPDGARIAIGSSTWRALQEEGGQARGVAYVADAVTGAGLYSVEHLNQIWAIAFSPDGALLATGSGETSADKDKGVWKGSDVRLWNAATGAPLRVLSRPHARAQSQIVFSPDGMLLATGDGPEGDVLVWQTQSGALRHTLHGHEREVYSLAFSRNGRHLATGSRDGTVRLWDVFSGTLRQTLTGHETAVHAVAFGSDDRTLVSADTQRGVLKVWQVT